MEATPLVLIILAVSVHDARARLRRQTDEATTQSSLSQASPSQESHLNLTRDGLFSPVIPPRGTFVDIPLGENSTITERFGATDWGSVPGRSSAPRTEPTTSTTVGAPHLNLTHNGLFSAVIPPRGTVVRVPWGNALHIETRVGPFSWGGYRSVSSTTTPRPPVEVSNGQDIPEDHSTERRGRAFGLDFFNVKTPLNLAANSFRTGVDTGISFANIFTNLKPIQQSAVNSTSLEPTKTQDSAVNLTSGEPTKTQDSAVNLTSGEPTQTQESAVNSTSQEPTKTQESAVNLTLGEPTQTQESAVNLTLGEPTQTQESAVNSTSLEPTKTQESAVNSNSGEPTQTQDSVVNVISEVLVQIQEAINLTSDKPHSQEFVNKTSEKPTQTQQSVKPVTDNWSSEEVHVNLSVTSSSGETDDEGLSWRSVTPVSITRNETEEVTVSSSTSRMSEATTKSTAEGDSPRSNVEQREDKPVVEEGQSPVKNTSAPGNRSLLNTDAVKDAVKRMQQLNLQLPIIMAPYRRCEPGFRRDRGRCKRIF